MYHVHCVFFISSVHHEFDEGWLNMAAFHSQVFPFRVGFHCSWDPVVHLHCNCWFLVRPWRGWVWAFRSIFSGRTGLPFVSCSGWVTLGHIPEALTFKPKGELKGYQQTREVGTQRAIFLTGSPGVQTISNNRFERFRVSRLESAFGIFFWSWVGF